MDNLTHSLFGATLARTPLGRAGRGATAALILASNAPDIDVVTAAGGALNYLQWHRGPTHGPLGVIGLGLITAGIVWSASRLLDRGGQKRHASFAALAAISTLGVLFHVLMDLPTSYGTRALSPFLWQWFAVDWMPIIEIYLLVTLAACLIFGSRGSEADRRRNAALALGIMVSIYGIRGLAHQRAVALAPRVFGPILPARCPGVPPQRFVDRWPRPAPELGGVNGRCLMDVAAMPDFVSPFRWRLVAHLSNAYESQEINVLDARFRRPAPPTEAMWRRTLREPNQWTPAVLRAAATPAAQTFLGFSRFPAARSVIGRDGATTVRWNDMRYIPPGRPRNDNPTPRGSLFSATVELNERGEVIDARLGP
jgi:membrane-bound metal-dependent hydrolase YbcI (DUF457 family)